MDGIWMVYGWYINGILMVYQWYMDGILMVIDGIQCGPPSDVCWFISPSGYSYKYHKR